MKIKVNYKNWQQYRNKPLTVKQKRQLQEANQLYALQVDEERRREQAALSKIPKVIIN
jgi:hypothetical protein